MTLDELIGDTPVNVNVTQWAGVVVPAFSFTDLTALIGKFTGISSLVAILKGLIRKDEMDSTAKTELNAPIVEGGVLGTYDEAADSLQARADATDTVDVTKILGKSIGSSSDPPNVYFGVVQAKGTSNRAALELYGNGSGAIEMTDTANSLIFMTPGQVDGVYQNIVLARYAPLFSMSSADIDFFGEGATTKMADAILTDPTHKIPTTAFGVVADPDSVIAGVDNSSLASFVADELIPNTVAAILVTPANKIPTTADGVKVDAAATENAFPAESLGIGDAVDASATGLTVAENLDAKVSDMSSSGSGGVATVIAVEDTSGSPLDGVAVWITSDEAGVSIVAGKLYSNALGQVTFMLEVGTWYVWRQKGGTDFTNPQTIAVT